MATEGYHSTSANDTAPADDADPTAALLVPSLFAGLDSPDSHATHTAGYSLYLLANDSATAARAIARELVERLSANPDRMDVRRTLASLRLADDEAVRAALLAATSHDRARKLYAVVQETDPWDPPRPLSADGGDHTQFATAFRQVIDPDDPGSVDAEADREERTTVIEAEDDDRTEHDSDDADQAGATPTEQSGTSQATLTKRERIERVAASDTFQTIAHRSGFDDLSVVAPETERRYANVLRARARAEDTERGVAVRLLHDPEDGFDGALATTLGSWAQLVEAPGVVTVVDWGTTPRPWVATEYVEETLARRETLDAREALEHARTLTGALVALHQQELVHGGIDPRNVVYAANTLGERRPMLDNAGLLGVYRQAFDPADYLDPRYAAPEYFDSQYGRLDHATDVYQLGMVIYRLCAGRHPFDGSYEEIRAGVLNDRPPAPSECTPALPEAIDEVVAKATAKQKLTRYETAHALHQDVTRICDAVL